MTVWATALTLAAAAVACYLLWMLAERNNDGPWLALAVALLIVVAGVAFQLGV